MGVLQYASSPKLLQSVRTVSRTKTGRGVVSLKLYFLRHGETTYSKTGAYCREVDADLTPDGVRMAKAFADAYGSVAWTAVDVSPYEAHDRNRTVIV